ncbi:MAG: DUF4292 domain-containing protein [Bacteroidales bacterium]|nr:DUF4292 domain-containing protein [Bacteroidales bacterium]
MKINNRIQIFVFAIMLMTVLGACASKKSVASDSVANQNSETAIIKNKNKVGDALALYKDWTSAQISGKLHLSSLPVSPSLKIYMKKGKELTISASAILVGEVFRVELTEDSLFVVNKLKKVYCKESGEKLRDIYPTFCEELQSVFLGRMIVPGCGTLSASNLAKIEVEMENDMRKVIPDLGEFPIDVSAFYLLDSDGRVSDLIVEGEQGKRLFTLDYTWKGNGSSDIDAVLNRGNKPVKVEISLDSPKWGASPLSRFKLGKDYKRVGFKEFFKTI